MGFFALAFTAMLIIGIAVGGQFININFFDNVPVTCYVDGKKVYQGTSAGINVDSSGASTTVRINGGFMYFFPKEYYVSNKVEMKGSK